MGKSLALLRFSHEHGLIFVQCFCFLNAYAAHSFQSDSGMVICIFTHKNYSIGKADGLRRKQILKTNSFGVCLI
jgi:hypothetical protein